MNRCSRRAERTAARVACAALVAGLVAAGAGTANALSETLLIGDSITSGVVSPEGSTDPPYAQLLGDLLAGTSNVTTAAQSGSSTPMWRPDADCPIAGLCGDEANLYDHLALPGLPADVATVLLGTNDAVGLFLVEGPTSPEQYETNVRDIVDALFADGAGNIVLMTAPRNENASAEGQARLAGYRDAIFAICGAVGGVVCGPDLWLLLDPASDFAPNDVHPNGGGHQKIADALFATLNTIPEPRTGALLAAGLALTAALASAASPRTREGRQDLE